MSELPQEPVDRRLTGGFEQLRRVSPAAPFAPAATIRRRGRRRGRRRAAATAVATLALVGLGVGGVVVVTEQAAPPTRPPAATVTVPAPPTIPATIEIPDEWLLASDDLGSGEWQTGWEPERFEGEPFQLWAGICAAVGPEDFPSVAQRRGLRTVTWSDQSGGDADPDGFEWVDQVVDSYAPGGAGEHIDELRHAVATCRVGDSDGGSRDSGRSGPLTVRFQVVASDFAGDQAVLVEEETGEQVNLTAVVRVGDTVTTLRHHHPETGRADRQRLIELSVVAADRLR